MHGGWEMKSGGPQAFICSHVPGLTEARKKSVRREKDIRPKKGPLENEHSFQGPVVKGMLCTKV
jgi:hypothetical protein